ncbi:MAG: hypothetical protein HQL95_00060 [Magnetococcales bacterium]|nr:hypothetical protein [Magnetococcales bacterium]
MSRFGARCTIFVTNAVLCYVLLLLLNVTPATGASCVLFEQQPQLQCSDIDETKNMPIRSTVVATRIINDETKIKDIRESMCSLYDRLENQKTKLNNLPYKPFLLELTGKNGKTWSMHIGCFQDQAKSKIVLQDIRNRQPDLKGSQRPYPFPVSLEMVSRKRDVVVASQQEGEDSYDKIIPGRYTQAKDVIDGRIDKEVTFFMVGGNERKYTTKNVEKYIYDKFGKESVDLRFDKSDQQEKIVVKLKSTPILLSDLYAMAAEITTDFRRNGLSCSEAVVLRGNEAGIRICEYSERKEDCRCSVKFQP